MPGKVTKANPKSPNSKPKTQAILLPPEVSSKVNELRAEAQKQFLDKQFMKAAELYDAAVKTLPEGAPEKIELWHKKVGCLLNAQRYKEAAKEASAVLDIAPTSFGVLKSRAKAYEQMGLLKQALSDVQQVNRTDQSTAETKEMEKRLKDIMAGRRERPSSAPSGQRASSNPNASIQVKASLGSETRVLHIGINTSYAELLDTIRAKFPTSGPVMLKYIDKDGDVITISSRQDIQVALGDLLQQYQKIVSQNPHARGNNAPGLPALRLQVVQVASEAEVPKPPAAEIAERGGVPQETQAYDAPVIDDWLMNFMQLFEQVTGLSPHPHADSFQQANEKLLKGMQDTIQHEEAEGLIDQAAEHYRDAVVMSYIQWGNTNITKADRKLQAFRKAAADAEGNISNPDWLSGANLDEILGLYDKTEEKVRQALAVHPNSWEATGSLAQLEWERAKAKMGYVLPLLNKPEEAASTEEANKSLHAALKSISKENAAKAKPHLEKVNSIFEDTLKLAQQSYETQKAREAASKAKQAAKDGSPAAQENGDKEAEEKLPVTSAPANVLIMHGNALYEWSQVLAALGEEPWRPVLDAAAAKFRASGAAEADVRAALKNHTMKDELDLGPDPEPEAPTTPVKEVAPVETKAPKPEAKGLPSLDVKKSKK